MQNEILHLVFNCEVLLKKNNKQYINAAEKSRNELCNIFVYFQSLRIKQKQMLQLSPLLRKSKYYVSLVIVKLVP